MEMLVGRTAPVHDGTGQKNRRRQRKKLARERAVKQACRPGKACPSVIVHLSRRRPADYPDSAA